ncbi:MAG: DNA-binding response regulator [Gammaproteobacteria bacterium]|nr:DNA-binding response regulator [Gammaproteobacteria bacterium]MDH5801636.1 DNA-binding response regulator [Gammaproteobacteria bacterium]
MAGKLVLVNWSDKESYARLTATFGSIPNICMENLPYGEEVGAADEPVLYVFQDSPEIDLNELKLKLSVMSRSPNATVLVVSYHESVKKTVMAFRLGVLDYLVLPGEVRRLVSFVEQHMKNTSPEVKTVNFTAAEKIGKAINTIVTEYRKDLRMDKLAASCNMSESSLYKYFKKETGVSIREYIKNKRIEAAKQLLLSTDLSVKKISYQVGYKNISLFNRIFKDSTGMSPTEFREMNLCYL